VDREEFLVLDDFSENDPFYKDLVNKTLMGRFGNIMLINNQEKFVMKAKENETIRFFTTNTANTRTFDFSISQENYIQPLKIVGGDIGRIEQEFIANNFVIAPAERYIFETKFSKAGEFVIKSRGKILGKIIIEKNDKESDLEIISQENLRKNEIDYLLIRNNFEKLLAKKNDKKLRISIGMRNRGEMRRGTEHLNGEGEMMGGNIEDIVMQEELMGGDSAMMIESDGDRIEWEDAMPMMNEMTNDEMMEWMLIDETDGKNPRKNMEIDWRFKKDDLVKIEIFNDPRSMHPIQHPIHFHGQRFIVLTRDGKPNQNLQWKDTVLIENGEKIEIILNTTNVGKWMSHCHIAEHLHTGMMFNFTVK
jgi:FtsP/CotA-like multicopper oxidase with cupredoxin domain